jgi:hypothetical protein
VRGFLNEDNNFIKGEWSGESLEDVVMEDPVYVQFLLDEHDLNEEEADLMRETLEKFSDGK